MFHTPTEPKPNFLIPYPDAHNGLPLPLSMQYAVFTLDDFLIAGKVSLSHSASSPIWDLSFLSQSTSSLQDSSSSSSSSASSSSSSSTPKAVSQYFLFNPNAS